MTYTPTPLDEQGMLVHGIASAQRVLMENIQKHGMAQGLYEHLEALAQEQIALLCAAQNRAAVDWQYELPLVTRH